MRFDSPAAAIEPCRFPDFDVAGIDVIDVEALHEVALEAGTRLEFESLAAMLEGEEIAAIGPVPFIPFVDASMVLSARRRYFDFEGGKGVLFLAEWSPEPSSAGQLHHVLQGLTSDRSRYVLGVFPARIRHPLPAFRWRRDLLTDGDLQRFERYRA